MSETILDEAARLVDGDRQADYGHPSDNHGCTAALWSAYLRRRGLLESELHATDVCMLNALQKVSRYAHTPTRDCLVDLAGYARNAEMVCSSSGVDVDEDGMPRSAERVRWTPSVDVP